MPWAIGEEPSLLRFSSVLRKVPVFQSAGPDETNRTRMT